MEREIFEGPLPKGMMIPETAPVVETPPKGASLLRANYVAAIGAALESIPFHVEILNLTIAEHAGNPAVVELTLGISEKGGESGGKEG